MTSSSPATPRIVFAGTPEFAVPVLSALAAAGASPVAVYTQPDRPAGRGRQLTPSPVKRWATGEGIPVLQPESLAPIPVQQELAAWHPDLVVVVAYGLLLPRAVLAIPRLGCVNVHASLLPRWRGAAPIQRAILAGDAQTGVCLMQMEAGLDTGPVYCCSTLPITPDSTAATLHDRLAAAGAALLQTALPELLEGQLLAQAQPAEGVTYAHKITKAEAGIDWTQTAQAIDRQIRAFNPWPIAQTTWNDRVLRIHAAHPVVAAPVVAAPVVAAPVVAAPVVTVTEAHLAGTQTAAQDLDPLALGPLPLPGTITAITHFGVQVQTGAGELCLTQVQLPGRRVIPALDWARTESLPQQRLGSGD